MSAGHGGEDLAARDSPLHRLDPRTKILGLIGLAVVSVSTPPGAWAAFAAYGAVLAALVGIARLPLRAVLRRAAVEVPFLVTAAVLVVAVPDGAVRGGTLAAKVTIGVLAMVVLSSTTPFPRLLRGFEVLRAPRAITVIVAFMWRYAHVLGDEIARMRTARDARGWSGRWLWQAMPVAQMIATLFLRALERGERVFLAMLARGYQGGMPPAVGERLAFAPADAAFGLALGTALLSARVALP